MPLKTFKPTTPGLRHTALVTTSDITKYKPEKSLTLPKKGSGGRNNFGHVTSRFKGGGHKRKIRNIDFKRDKRNVPAQVIAIEYDPNRSSRIALLEYEDKERRYILAPMDLKVGDKVEAGSGVEIKPGNALPLRDIPLGIPIHNLEIASGRGGQFVRGAGNLALILAKEGDSAQVKLPSDEVRLFRLDCYATIGQVGNPDHENISVGKAGRSRHLGIMPHVRGVAQNPVDHPHGGGEGKSPQGNPHPVSPWGQLSKGFKTRKRRKYSDRYIIKNRNQ